MFKTLTLGMIILIFPGCSNNLSRGKAEDLIVKKYNVPSIETIKIRKVYLRGETMYSINQGDERIGNDLKSKGLITIVEDNEVTNNGFNRYTHWTKMNVVLTLEGKKYFISEHSEQLESGTIINVYEVKTCDISFGEISGIQEQEQLNVAEVSYNLVRKNITPIGMSYNITEGIIEKKDVFTKYDDGWRFYN